MLLCGLLTGCTGSTGSPDERHRNVEDAGKADAPGHCEPNMCPGDRVCVGGQCTDPSSDGDNDGVAAASDCDDTDPNVGAQAERSCQTECGSGVERCVDGEWQPCDAPTDCGQCEDGETRTMPCGPCGEMTQVCEGSEWTDGPCEEQGVCEPGRIEEGGPCGSCGTMQRQCTQQCTWGDFQCVECDQAVCDIVGGCGVEIQNTTTDRSTCEQMCRDEADEHPNRKCRFGDEVFREYPIERCRIEGGCGAELFEQQTDSCACLQECNARSDSNPNRRCVFGSQVLREQPIERCRIEGGCGAEVFNQQTDSCTCLRECSNHSDREHRSCIFGGDEVLRAKPTGTCHIESSGGRTLFDGRTIHCDCLRECQNRQDSYPDRSCVWDGSAIPAPWGTGM
jgi:hypothetical protein